MKKLIAAILVAVPLVFTGSAGAATPTPSTNADNAANKAAHFVVNDSHPGEIDVTFNPNMQFSYSFYSCFEYRSDDAPTTDPRDNFNPEITDGLWPYICVNAEPRDLTIPACDYVDIRMVFGAEKDERFDWTRVDVDPGPDCPTDPDNPVVDTPTSPAPTQPAQQTTEAPQVDAPVKGVDAGAGAVLMPIAALSTSAATFAYGLIRLRKYGLE